MYMYIYSTILITNLMLMGCLTGVTYPPLLYTPIPLVSTSIVNEYPSFTCTTPALTPFNSLIPTIELNMT